MTIVILFSGDNKRISTFAPDLLALSSILFTRFFCKHARKSNDYKY